MRRAAPRRTDLSRLIFPSDFPRQLNEAGPTLVAGTAESFDNLQEAAKICSQPQSFGVAHVIASKHYLHITGLDQMEFLANRVRVLLAPGDDEICVCVAGRHPICVRSSETVEGAGCS